MFAWLQPAGSPGTAAALPGMAGIVGWTTLALAVPVAVLLISVLLGIGKNGKYTMPGGPWMTLVLAFSLLNVVMLSVLIWVAHLVGPVTTSAGDAASHAKIYIPYVITSGVPIVVFAAVVVAIVFLAAEIIRWRLASRLPDEVVGAYQERTKAFRASKSKSEQLKPWYYAGTSPFSPTGDDEDPHRAKKEDPHWVEKIARARMLGSAPHDLGWLLWGIIVLQLAAALWTWQLHKEPPLFISNAGIAIAGLLLPTLMGFLYAAWSDPAKRRQIGVLWDVGTFWPRSYHPLSPPCYAERAVPDLQRRLWWLHDNDGRGSVVLVGHSQGTMLAIAALVQKEHRPAGGGHVSLITFGSPVGKLYAWAFPAYITTERLAPLAPGGGGNVRDWLNFYYPTDPIGGLATEGIAFPAGQLVNRLLPDPADSWYVYGQPLPAPQGHSGYWADPRVWNAINHVAAVSQGNFASSQLSHSNSAGALTRGADAALEAAGGISGTVTAAADGKMLGNVTVKVFSGSRHSVGSARTARDGTYTVTGLSAAVPGYTVCFEASDATGGSSSHGYVSQCYRNVPWDGRTRPTGATSVPVTAGALTLGADAALDVKIVTSAKDLASKVP